MLEKPVTLLKLRRLSERPLRPTFADGCCEFGVSNNNEFISDAFDGNHNDRGHHVELLKECFGYCER